MDVDYYVHIGGSAYHQLAGMPLRIRSYASVYEELSANFRRFVDVLAEVSEGASIAASDANVVQLYERWLRTGSEWVARRLRALGVLPGTPDVQ